MLVANEADLSALAEHRRGAGVQVDDLLFISGEVGVGGGLIVDGRPMTGAFGFGGEIGHMPLNPEGVAVRLRFRGVLGNRVWRDRSAGARRSAD